MRHNTSADYDYYASIPHHVMDSQAYTRASHRAKAMLMELCRQLTSSNNGRLQLTSSWLSTRGWASHYSIQKARDELFELGLIIRTKQGGLHQGPAQYAISWRPISKKLI